MRGSSGAVRRRSGAMAGAAGTVLLALVLGFVAAAANAQVPPGGGDPALGHRLALQVCAACHIVAADQALPPILRPPAPSFRAIARKPGTTAASLRSFLSTTHTAIGTPASMPNPELTDEQAADVAAYILSLQTRR